MNTKVLNSVLCMVIVVGIVYALFYVMQGTLVPSTWTPAARWVWLVITVVAGLVAYIESDTILKI